MSGAVEMITENQECRIGLAQSGTGAEYCVAKPKLLSL